MRRGDLAGRLRRRVAGDRRLDRRRRPDHRLRNLRRGRPRRRARAVRRTAAAGAATGKRGKPSGATLFDRTSRPATGTPWRRLLADDVCIDDRRRVVNAGVRHGRDAEIARHAGDRRRRDQERDVNRDRGPRGAPRPQSSPRLGRRSESEASADARVLEIDADEPDRGTRPVRPRRHRRRLRGTRRPIPRRRSGRLTHTRGRLLRGSTPHSTGTNFRPTTG